MMDLVEDSVLAVCPCCGNAFDVDYEVEVDVQSVGSSAGVRVKLNVVGDIEKVEED